MNDHPTPPGTEQEDGFDGHYLLIGTILSAEDGTPVWMIEHPEGCPTRVLYAAEDGSGGVVDEACTVGFQVSDGGIDAFGSSHRYVKHRGRHIDQGWPVGVPSEPGRYRIAAWSHVSPGGEWGPEEWDGGLDVIKDKDGAPVCDLPDGGLDEVLEEVDA